MGRQKSGRRTGVKSTAVDFAIVALKEVCSELNSEQDERTRIVAAAAREKVTAAEQQKTLDVARETAKWLGQVEGLIDMIELEQDLPAELRQKILAKLVQQKMRLLRDISGK